MDYYKVYLQAESDKAPVKETISDFGMYCMDIPFMVANTVKEPTSRNWYDEDGSDVYVPSEGLKMAPYTMEVKFGYKGDQFSANDKINAFVNYLKQASMKMYCDYTKVGRRHVIFSELNDKAELFRDQSGDLLIVTVKFNVTDPVTNVEPEYSLDKKVISLS
jgi:hypothetical protein